MNGGSTGEICDRRVSAKVKVYEIVTRPPIMYEPETVSPTKKARSKTGRGRIKGAALFNGRLLEWIKL